MAQGLILFLILFPMAMAPVVFPLRRRDRGLRDCFIQRVPLVELAAALLLLAFPAAELSLPWICGLGLHFSAGSLGRLLAVVAALLWAGTGAVSPPYFASAEGCNRYYFFWLLTQGALMGVFLAGDLFTLFVFFEMMSFTSYVWVAQNETPQALRAADTYLAVAVIGGMTLLVGLLWLGHLLGEIASAAFTLICLFLIPPKPAEGSASAPSFGSNPGSASAPGSGADARAPVRERADRGRALSEPEGPRAVPGGNGFGNLAGRRQPILRLPVVASLVDHPVPHALQGDHRRFFRVVAGAVISHPDGLHGGSDCSG